MRWEPGNFLEHLIGPVLVLIVGAVLWRFVRTGRERDHAAPGRGEPGQRPWPWKRGLLSGVALAASYLLVFRLLSLLPPYVYEQRGGPVLMSFSFLFLGPFVAGFYTVDRGEVRRPLSASQFIFAPWIPVLLNLALALAVYWEGLICAIFILPPAMLSASLGGVTAGVLLRWRNERASRNTLLCLGVAPLSLCMLEVELQQPREVRIVPTEVLIHAPLPVVWRNIERVRPIAATELRPSWANRIGFPRPVEATLSHEGVGGVRNASFERGLNFVETVTEWDPQKRLAFTIVANTAAIPATTLDAHVTVGGRFFDVLTGEYQLEPLPGGNTLLHLTSRQRLSTDFNEYAALRSDAVMSDLQTNILHVVRARCEAEARTLNATNTQNDKGR